jgi:hypothetical protein
MQPSYAQDLGTGSIQVGLRSASFDLSFSIAR